MRGSSTTQTAVTELQYVVPKLGASLQAVEIGNQLNLYNVSNIESIWHSYAQAIHTNFAGTAVAGPEIFEDINDATNFINGEKTTIDLVTHHYYRGQAGTSVARLAGDMLSTTASAGSSNLHAYTVSRSDGATVVVLVNGEASTGVNATVDVEAAVSSATAVYLRGPSLTATSGVTLAQTPVNPDGNWSPQAPYTLSHTGNTLTVPVPAASAVMITVN